MRPDAVAFRQLAHVQPLSLYVGSSTQPGDSAAEPSADSMKASNDVGATMLAVVTMRGADKKVADVAQNLRCRPRPPRKK